MNTAMSLLTEIRDLLALQLQLQTPEKKTPQKKSVKPQPKGKPERPSQLAWSASPFPIQRWKLGTAKHYPIEKKKVIHNRVWWVNARMKEHGFLPHWSYSTVMRRGRLYVEIRRDR